MLIYCHCAYYQIIPDSVKKAVLNAVKAAGVEFEAVPDLCRMCAKRDSRLKDWANAESLRIFACYPRAVRWLFYAAGAPLPPQGVEFVNMRTLAAGGRAGDLDSQISNFKLEISDSRPHDRDLHLKSEILNVKSEARPPAARARPPAARVRAGDWIPWFPVIDYGRCENCKQCLGFCLFGVYELSDDGKVEVRNPANCKTNCPACARACPNSAIIFPKYGEGPINGDEVKEQASQDKESKADLARPSTGGLADLLSGDVYNTIRKRGKGGQPAAAGKRFSAGADAQEKADLSGKSSSPGRRRASLKELQEKLAIPPEVLASLSPAEMIGIRKRALAAGGRAAEKKRRNARQSPNGTGKTGSEDYE